MSDSEIARMPALELSQRYRSKSLSPVEVAERLLERIEAGNRQLNAFYEIDREGALAQARASETRWQKGEPLGLFDGVPTSIKDALLTTGAITHRGAAITDGVAKASTIDAPSVARLKEEGAVILGRTTMCDFGILGSGVSSKHGVTRNPWKLSATPGGSSSGAAAAIAAGMQPVAVGTDIVGSVRLPASFCGLVGLKPSQGRVPYYFPNSPALVAGPMARTVEDAAALLNIISRPDSRDFTALPYTGVDYLQELEAMRPAPRVGFLEQLGFGPAPDAKVLELTEKAVRVFADVRYKVVSVKPPFTEGEERAAEDFYRMRAFAELSQYPAERQKSSPHVYPWSRSVERMTGTALMGVIGAMSLLREKACRMMDGLDYLILPSAPFAPFAAELPAPDPQRVFDPWTNTFLFNLTEQPAISVPCGLTHDGLPVGLQIVGQRFDDAGVLRMARLFEKVVGPFPMAAQ